MEIINVEVEKETKELLERLVRKKAYSSISEAVRQIINDHLIQARTSVLTLDSRKVSWQIGL